MINAKEYFVDIEVEGKYKGEKTLFIVDYYNVENIINIIKQDSNISQIYFGAGFQSEIKDFNVVRHFLTKNIIVSIEVLDLIEIPIDILNDSRCHKIITLKQNNNYNYQNNFTFKVENKYGITCFINSIYNTWKSYNN